METKQKTKNIFAQEGRKESALERFAIGSTRYIGSPTSLVIHTIFFVVVFGLQKFGFTFEQTMLILTTAVSLEAIYLSLFIQMTVNRQARQIEEVSDDVDDIQEDVEEISKDIDEIQEDVEDIQENTEDIKENVEDLSDDLEESTPMGDEEKVEKITRTLEELLQEVKTLKRNQS